MSSPVILRAGLRTGATLLSITLGLAACGGGGGDSGSANANGGAGGTPVATPAPVPVQAAAISTQPAPQSAAEGATATFSVSATGTDLTYQWRRDGKDIAGATAASYTLNNVQADDDGRMYTVEVKNSLGSIVSAPAPLAVAVPKGLSLVAGRLGGAGNFDGKDGRLLDVSALGVSPAGLVYVADTMSIPYGPGSLRTIDPATGAITTVQTYAENTLPWSIVFDADGNRYEMATSAVYKTTPAGVRTLLAGSAKQEAAIAVDGTGAAARFALPADMAIDGSGNLYVADVAAGRIRKIDPAGKVVTLAGREGGGFVDGQGGEARFMTPGRLAVDKAGNVFVLDFDNDNVGRKIRKVSPDGKVTTLALKASDGAALITGYGNYGSAIAVDTAGNLYVTDLREGCRIRRITPDGTLTDFVGGTATGSADGKGGAARFCSSARIRGLGSMKFDQAGNLLLTDNNNYSVRRITLSGDVTTIAGRPVREDNVDGKGGAAAFAFAPPNPRGTGLFYGNYNLAADAAGNLYVGAGDRIRKVGTAGDVTTLAPAAGVAAGARYFVGGLAFGRDALVLSDHVLRRVDANGTLRFVAGQPGAGRTQRDGTGADAVLEDPFDLIMDGLGTIHLRDYIDAGFPDKFYFSDRKITPQGVVTTKPWEGTMQSFSARYADKEGNVWIDRDGSVTVQRPDGSTATVRKSGMGAAQGRVTAITRDAAGNIYLATAQEAYPSNGRGLWHQIRKIAPDGAETIIAGTEGSSGVRLGSPGSLGRVDALAVGADGVLYLMTENAVLRLKQ